MLEKINSNEINRGDERKIGKVFSEWFSKNSIQFNSFVRDELPFYPKVLCHSFNYRAMNWLLLGGIKTCYVFITGFHANSNEWGDDCTFRLLLPFPTPFINTDNQRLLDSPLFEKKKIDKIWLKLSKKIRL